VTTPRQDAALDTARSRVVDLLSSHFAHDGIPVEELDRRLDLAYQARSLPDLEALVRDVPRAPAALARISTAVPAHAGDAAYDAAYDEPEGESERILAIMAETHRTGLWVVPRRLEVVSVMSETVLDLRQASLLAGVTDITVSGLMTQLTLIVPPDVRVVNRLMAFMATARDRTAREPDPGPGAAVIRVSGWVMMSEVVIKRATG
jgi:hypothetical protein